MQSSGWGNDVVSRAMSIAVLSRALGRRGWTSRSYLRSTSVSPVKCPPETRVSSWWSQNRSRPSLRRASFSKYLKHQRNWTFTPWIAVKTPPARMNQAQYKLLLELFACNLLLICFSRDIQVRSRTLTCNECAVEAVHNNARRNNFLLRDVRRVYLHGGFAALNNSRNSITFFRKEALWLKNGNCG